MTPTGFSEIPLVIGDAMVPIGKTMKSSSLLACPIYIIALLIVSSDKYNLLVLTNDK